MKKIFLSLLIPFILFASDFLMPDEAFEPSVTLQDSKIIVKIKLGDKIHLYSKKIKLSVESDTISSKEMKIHSKIIKSEEGEFIENEAVVSIALLKTTQAKENESIKIHLSFQGCSSEGLCYEPISREYEFKVTNANLELKKSFPVASQKKEPLLNETDTIADSFQNDSIFIVLLSFFGFGLLLSMTPCIFPMIPILSSIIVSQGEGMSAKRGFTLSLVYVLSMAFAYTLAGVLAGVFGSNIQAAMQNPYVVIAFSTVFVALAFSMFGFYEIGLPSSLASKLSKVSDSASDKGGFLGVSIMGFLSALIVGPCVAPPLAGTLVYIGQTGDALFGGVALFVMSLGLGMPLLFIGAGAGKFMPKPGGWMSSVSKVFGVVMLAIAIWMLEKIAPPSVTMLLWALLLLISAIYLGALEPLGERRSWNALNKGIALALLLVGASLLLGLLSGSTNIFKPFEKFTQGSVTLNSNATNELEFKVIKSQSELNILLAQNRGKKIMLDFAAKWCTSCKELDEITFKDIKVKEKLKNYLLIRADMTENSKEQKALTKAYGVFGPPAILFFDEEGKLLKERTIIGYKSPQEFLDIML